MAINTITYATLLQQKLDEQIVAHSTSGWMEANAGQVKYSGGKEIKVPSISTNGLADYDRDDGFVQGSVTFGYETLVMTQDRGRTFSLDAMDVDETNFLMNATTVAGEFQRTQVIPEIDAYRYSKLYAIAKAGNRLSTDYTPAKATMLDALRADISAIRDDIGEDIGLVITLSEPAATILDSVSDISKFISVADFRQGNISLKVKTLDEVPLRRVPSARMKSAYVFNDGTTEGQKEGGFKADDSTVQINWIIVAQNSPIAVSKTDKLRIFAPDVNQAKDAWKIDYRKYHELWLTKNKLPTLMVNAQPKA
jgi:hypothetical protein